jgi:deoxyadenosine/deoxycytidine kinase
MTKPMIISVEGNIGAGKTTIIEQMQLQMESDKIIFLREPVDLWESIKDPVDGESILVKFYKNPSKYAFSFQVMAYATRLSMIKNVIQKNPQCEVIICERSLDADKNIFAKMLHHDGLIENVEFQIYNKFYQEYPENYKLHKIIYIDADPDVCSNRIGKRGRDGEAGITLEYLEKCKNFHEKWLIEGEGFHPECRILHIKTNDNATYNKEDKTDCGNQWIQLIYEFIVN